PVTGAELAEGEPQTKINSKN
ncbi:hypothetical protein, partial [Escherichia coli]